MSTSTLPARRSPLAVIRALREAKAKGQNPAADISSRMALAEALEPRQLLTVTGASLGGPYPAAFAGSSVELFPAATTNHDPGSTYWNINFGDGTSMTTTVNGSASIAHTYSFAGTFTATAQVSDATPAGSYYYCSNAVTVADETITPSAGSGVFAMGQGQTVKTVTFSDNNPSETGSDLVATIYWGDGSSTAGTIVSDGGGNFEVSGAHTYTTADTFTGSVSIVHSGIATASASYTGTSAYVDSMELTNDYNTLEAANSTTASSLTVTAPYSTTSIEIAEDVLPNTDPAYAVAVYNVVDPNGSQIATGSLGRGGADPTLNWSGFADGAAFTINAGIHTPAGTVWNQTMTVCKHTVKVNYSDNTKPGTSTTNRLTITNPSGIFRGLEATDDGLTTNEFDFTGSVGTITATAGDPNGAGVFEVDINTGTTAAGNYTITAKSRLDPSVTIIIYIHI